MTATDQRATKRIGNRLSREMQDYGASLADLGRLIGISGGGVSKWIVNDNGVAFYRAQQLAFLLGITVDELANTGKFARPATGKPADLRELSQHIIQVVDAGDIKCPELALDAKTRAVTYLADVITMEEANKPATSKLGDVFPLSGPSNSCDARPALKREERQAEREPVLEKPKAEPKKLHQKSLLTPYERLDALLVEAELLREQLGVKWNVSFETQVLTAEVKFGFHIHEAQRKKEEPS